MFLLLCLSLSLTASRAAIRPTIAPSVLEYVFGTSAASFNRPVTQSPTVAPILQDSDGESCICVPYYLCDTNSSIARNLNDPTLTGYGKITERNNFDTCVGSVENCCKIPKIIKNTTLPKPDSSRIKGCGFRNPKGLDFTISATNQESQYGEFPWVVALLDATNDAYHGVGVIIHPQVVLTAAHVLNDLSHGNIKIKAGEWDTRTSGERLPVQERFVERIRVRKDFEPRIRFVANDIALLRLREPLQLSDHINVICLPDQDETFDNYKSCVANGWGKTSYGSTELNSVILKKIELDMVTSSTCNQELRSWLGPQYSTHDSIVCARGLSGQDTCQGDGGAPLACPVGFDQYKLSGLVVAGIGCEGQAPGIYTKVSGFRQWIDRTMDDWQFDKSVYSMRTLTFRYDDTDP